MNHWHQDRFTAAFRLLAMLPDKPVFTKQFNCQDLGLSDRFFRRLVDAMNETTIVKIASIHLPDGSVSYYRAMPTQKGVDKIVGIGK